MVPPPQGNTQVTVVLSSTANAQLAEFDLQFQSITLTSRSGKTATLLTTTPQGSGLGAEFVHINGTAEPLVRALIPQDIYTSATVSLGGGETVCVAYGVLNGQETLEEDFYTLLPQPATAAVNMATPITVTGASMALSLNLQVSQSATVGDCLNVAGFTGFSMTPTFNLSPLTLSSSPTNSLNGKVTALDGEITAVDMAGNSLTLSLPDADGTRSLVVSADSNTTYQGISNFSTLAAGTFVDTDGAIQPDGSLRATRIAVEDPSAGDVVRGPLLEVIPLSSSFVIHAREQQGKDFPGYVGGFGSFTAGTATFAISGQFTNLGSLPFVPSFSLSNMVPGQEVYVSAARVLDSSSPPAATLTLMPQTINATVTASSTMGNFTDYTVTLAPYDLFPMLAVQPNQTTVENNPSQVEVYVDNNTQLLNTQPLAAGSTLRFYGLVFNDNGTLRMDCAQVNDGVAFSSQANASNRPETGATRTVRRGSPSQTLRVINTISSR